jgi:hypothetical protein
MNPSGSIPGIISRQQFILVETPVDIWDTVMFFSSDGNWGSRSLGQGAQTTVANAITQYTQATGTAPTDVSQLISYSGISSMNSADLGEMFQALTVKPQ